MERKYRSNNNIVYSCKYHVVWCPKYRRQVLVNRVDVRLKEVLREVAAETQAEVMEIEVMPDHVHLLVEVDPQFGIHRLIKLMKGRSSRLLRQEFPWLVIVNIKPGHSMLKNPATPVGSVINLAGHFLTL